MDDLKHCPVCGYYCLGNGGMGCIDKPSTVDVKPEPAVPESELHELIDAIIELASAIRSLDKAKESE